MYTHTPLGRTESTHPATSPARGQVMETRSKGARRAYTTTTAMTREMLQAGAQTSADNRPSGARTKLMTELGGMDSTRLMELGQPRAGTLVPGGGGSWATTRRARDHTGNKGTGNGETSSNSWH